MQFADGLYARGLYDLAVKEYLSAATNAAVTNAGVAWFRAGECHRQLGRRAEAASCYRRSADEFPQNPMAGRAAFRYAEIAVTGGEYVDAVNRFRALVDSHPPSDILAPALYYLGYAQGRMNLTAEAERALRRLVSEFPESPHALLGRVDLAAMLEAGKGHEKEIAGLLAEAADRGQGTSAGAQALLKLGDRAYRARDYAGSAAAYSRLLRDYPSDARAREARLPAAWALYRAGRAEEALPVIAAGFTEAPAPSHAEWLYVKANCLRLLDRAAEAQEVYAQLLKAGPESTWAQPALYEMAVMAFKGKDAARALELASRVQPAADLAPDVIWLRAESARELGKSDEALRDYDQLARDYPAGDRTAAARFQAARIIQQQGRMQEAAERYRALAKDHPKDDVAGDAWYAAAYCRVVLKDYEAALADWGALLREPGKFERLDEALYGMAQAQVELKRDDDARATLERLLKEHPRSRLAAEAHYLMGSLLESAEKWDVAEYHYRMATLKKPDPALVRKIEFRRVAVLQRQGQHDDAAAVLNGLVEAGAGDEVPASLLDWLVRWNTAQRRYEDAERAAVALAGQKGSPAWRQIGWYFAGRSRQELGRAAAAREAYEQSMNVEAATREGVEAALFLGQVASGEGDWQKARAAWSAAAERASTDDMADIRARSYFGLGQAAAAQEQWDEAARSFMGVAVLYDDPTLAPEALFRAAEAFGKVGRAAERDRTLAELRERYPDSSWTAKATAP